MKIINRTAIVLLLAVAAVAAAAYVGLRIGSGNKAATPANADKNLSLKTYVSKQLKLSFSYPASPGIGAVEDGNPLSIGVLAGEPPTAIVYAQDTGYANIKDWFAAQPKGDSSHAGIKPLMWIDTDRLIAEEYVVVDYNGNKPIYGKYLEAFVLQGAKLSKLKFGGETKAADAVTTTPDELTIVSTLQFEL